MKLRPYLINQLRKVADWLEPPMSHNITAPVANVKSQGKVVQATTNPRWTPHQSGAVIVTEPREVQLERANLGDKAVDDQLYEM